MPADADAAVVPSLAGSGARAFDLLRITGRMLRAHWPALLCWFFLQRLAYQALLALAVRLGQLNRPLGFFGLSLVIVTQLLCTIAMFQALRPSMPALAHAVDEAEAGGEGPLPGRWTPARRVIDAIAVALLPFFAYYATWGLVGNLLRAYILDFLSSSVDLIPTDLLNAPGLWFSIVATWGLRRFSLWRHDRTRSALWSVVATVCAAYWVFLGLFAISQATARVWDWWHARVVYVAWQAWWEAPRSLFGLLPVLKSWLGPPLGLLWEALQVAALPLVWLAAAIELTLRHLQRTRPAPASA